MRSFGPSINQKLTLPNMYSCTEMKIQVEVEENKDVVRGLCNAVQIGMTLF
jgi:hypothetical protein